ncbi:hypothetical protein [Marinoscillum sp.]|uniref:hypothetical protein n=1 Tax=Marinoscillum sp. TaxID=2024838 RepID=UPI003BAC4FE4
MNKLFFGLGMMLTWMATAQESTIVGGDVQDLSRVNNSGILFNNRGYAVSKYSGSPFLAEEWAKGSVTLKDEGKIDDLLLVLDFYKKELYVEKNGKSIAVPKANLEAFSLTLNGQQVNFIPVEMGNETVYGELLYRSEKFDLLKITEVTFIDADQYDQTFKSGNPNDEYRQSAKFYMDRAGELIKLPSSKGRFSKLFPGEEKAVKSYLKNQNIDLSSQRDLVITFEKLDNMIR